MLRRIAAVLAAALPLLPGAAGAQASGTIVATVRVLDVHGTAMIWYPCRTLTVEARAVALVQTARAATAGPGTCSATIAGIAALVPATVSVSVHPNLRCASHTNPRPVPATRVPAGGRASVDFVLAFACDAAMLARSLRARGVSLEAAPHVPLDRALESRFRVVPPASAVPITTTRRLAPAMTGTIEWQFGERGGICAPDQAWDGLPREGLDIWHRVWASILRPGGVGVGFVDGTWSTPGVCGATTSSVWEGWVRFDLSQLASSGGYFGTATLVTENEVIGFTNAAYAAVGRSCIHAVIAADSAYNPYGTIDGHSDAASVLQLPGHRAVPAGHLPPATTRGGASDYTVFADVTPIVRAWLRGTPNYGFILVEPPLPATHPHDNESCWQVVRPLWLVITPAG